MQTEQIDYVFKEITQRQNAYFVILPSFHGKLDLVRLVEP